MTDREPLEMAAKAAGYELDYTIRPDGKAFYNTRRNAIALADGRWFAPFSDDGDALRLAVKLKIDVCHTNIHSAQVHAMADYEVACIEDSGDDSCAATRRAIVRAAAEIGKNLCSNSINTSTKE